MSAPLVVIACEGRAVGSTFPQTREQVEEYDGLPGGVVPIFGSPILTVCRIGEGRDGRLRAYLVGVPANVPYIGKWSW